VIDFRYHIVSLIAVFLALGIGVIMGTTVVDDAIVARLEDDIDRGEQRVRSERRERQSLDVKLEKVEQFFLEGKPFLLEDRLAGHTVLLWAPQGIEQKLVQSLTQTLVMAGAEVPGVLWFTEKMDLLATKDKNAQKELAAILGVTTNDAAVFQSTLIEQLASVFTGLPLEGAQETVPVAVGENLSLVHFLLNAGYLAYEHVQVLEEDFNETAFRGEGNLMLIVGSDKSEVGNSEFLVPFSRAMAAGKRTVAVQGNDDNPDFLNELRALPSVRAQMSTVDHVHEDMGAYAMVAALAMTPDQVHAQLGTETSYFSGLLDKVDVTD